MVTASHSAGEYRIVNLPAGTYTVVVTAAGFSKAELKGLQIELNVTATANVTLQIGKSVETVEVTANAVTIDTTTAQLQNTFETQQMMDLPNASSGSGVINLSLLAAGVATSGGVGARHWSQRWRSAPAQQQLHHRRHRQQQRQRHRSPGGRSERRRRGVHLPAESVRRGLRPLLGRPVQPGGEERHQRSFTARRTST